MVRFIPLRSSFIHVIIPQPLHLRVLPPFSPPPPPNFCLPFIHFTSEASRGKSGSFGDFRSNAFILANQVTSSIFTRVIVRIYVIVSPLLDRPSLSSFSSIPYFLRHLPALSSSVNGLPSFLLSVTHISSRFPIYSILH